MKAVYWVRQDLRWHDNQTLRAFCAQATEGVFVWCETKSFQRATGFRRQFILDSLSAFKAKVEGAGGSVLISSKKAPDFFPSFVAENKIEALFYTSDCATEEIAEESLIDHLPLKTFQFDQGSLIRVQDLPMAIEKVPEQFTNFRKLVEKDLKIDAPTPEPERVPRWSGAQSNSLHANELANSKAAAANVDFVHPKIRGGEVHGLNRLQEYIWDEDRLKVYKDTRNGMLDWNDSSKLSPWLSVGALSPRTIYQEIKKYEGEVIANDSTYWLFFELLWRDYFRFISLKWGPKLFREMHAKPKPPSILSEEKQRFELWAQAQTGDDFIDANMEEFNQTGWMSNRGRQNVASFLAKTMQVNWIWGAEYFEEKLIDYDASSNWGNWSYLAGVGQDPRDRTFKSHRQAEHYDPNSDYRKKWLKGRSL